MEECEDFGFRFLQKRGDVHNFVFDVYVDPISKENKVWLIDLNPWREFTNPLLFTFEELEALEIIKKHSESPFQNAD